ncbi:MAG: hypothetical protein DI617_08375, partial [Streptococcus pyogenes]
MKCIKCLERFDFIKTARETGEPPEWQTCPLPPLRNCESDVISLWSNWCDYCFCDLPLKERWPKCTPADLEQADQILNRRLYELRDARLAKENPKPQPVPEVKPPKPQPVPEVKPAKSKAALPPKAKAAPPPKTVKPKSKGKKDTAKSDLKPGEVPIEYQFAGELFSRLYGEKSATENDKPAA